MSLFLTFLIAATVLAFTPGPGIAYVIARTASGSRAEGLASCLGTALGGMVHVLAAAFGLSAALASSALAFSVVKYLGAAYLIYLGLRLLLSKQPTELAISAPALGFRRALRDGAVVEALNVKTAIFFLAILPQFVVVGEPLVPQFLILGTICVALNTGVDVLAVFGAARFVGSGAVKAARERLLTRASGVTMLGLGVYLAAAKREA